MAQRSQLQNNSMHKYFSLVAQALNDKGISPREFVKSDMPLRWSTKAVKAHFSGLFSDDFQAMPKKYKKAACKAIARTFNACGLDMRMHLPETAKLSWDKDLVKENIWRPVQQSLFGKESTTTLTRSEVTEVYEMVSARLADTVAITIEFPREKNKDTVPLKHETAQKMESNLPDDVYDIEHEPTI